MKAERDGRASSTKKMRAKRGNECDEPNRHQTDQTTLSAVMNQQTCGGFSLQPVQRIRTVIYWGIILLRLQHLGVFLPGNTLRQQR